jgi:hypothetical protein
MAVVDIYRLSGVLRVPTLPMCPEFRGGIMKSTSGKNRKVVARIDAAQPTEREPIGPLWVITICLGAFLVVAALVIMVG